MDPEATTSNTEEDTGESVTGPIRGNNGTGNTPPEPGAEHGEWESGVRIVLSPLDQAKKSAYEATVKKENSKNTFWKVLTFAIPAFLTIIGIIVGIYLGLFTYYLQSISGPMASMQTEIKYLKEGLTELKADVRGSERNLPKASSPLQ